MSFCPHCGKNLDALTGAAFCPFCGGAVEPILEKAGTAPEPREVQDLVSRVENMADVKKKHQLLVEAQEKYPDSLAIAQELLFMGRLHERGGRDVDFSIIKSYLLMLYLRPEEFTQKRQDELREELLRHPLLERCMALSGDPAAFFHRYLMRLSGDFIDLFLRGDSRYMRRIFGFGLDSQAPKYLAGPVANMLLNMRQDEKLTESQREELMRVMYQAYMVNLRETRWLDEKLREAGVSVEGMR